MEGHIRREWRITAGNSAHVSLQGVWMILLPGEGLQIFFCSLHYCGTCGDLDLRNMFGIAVIAPLHYLGHNDTRWVPVACHSFR